MALLSTFAHADGLMGSVYFYTNPQGYWGPEWSGAQTSCDAEWLETPELKRNFQENLAPDCPLDRKNFADFFKRSLALSANDIDVIMQQSTLSVLLEDYQENLKKKEPYFEGFQKRLHH